MAEAKRPAPADSTAPFSALVVAGTHSGVGKTSITLGLIAALRRRGLTVQPFKVGPDFIDPLHHQQASGRPARNLDSWMLNQETNRARYAAATADAQVALIEGVMGLYDGADGKTEQGSTAELAKQLDLPVVLVVDAAAIARSAAALIHGYTTFDLKLQIAGVILNNIGGPGHTAMIRDAVGNTTPILGALPRQPDLVVPERHLGLHLPHETHASYHQQLADLIEQHVDLDHLLTTSRSQRLAPPPQPRPAPASVRIGIARDEAFCFYYTDNLELLQQAGAELVEFSPIRDALPRNLDGLYIGGGYPELHAHALSRNTNTRNAIRDFAANGHPIYAECGGLMYLAQTLNVDGESHPMCDVFPLTTTIPAPLTIAYVEITTTGGLFGPGENARGHLFHQSEITKEPTIERSYQLTTNRGEQAREGYTLNNTLASYTHLHFASNPMLAKKFVNRSQPRQAG
jgi:cobyrinic acid a,c-diamide synthase